MFMGAYDFLREAHDLFSLGVDANLVVRRVAGSLTYTLVVYLGFIRPYTFFLMLNSAVYTWLYTVIRWLNRDEMGELRLNCVK